MDIMRESACLVVAPITVYSYVFFFNCRLPGLILNDDYDVKLYLVCLFQMLVFGWPHCDSTSIFPLALTIFDS